MPIDARRSDQQLAGIATCPCSSRQADSPAGTSRTRIGGLSLAACPSKSVAGPHQGRLARRRIPCPATRLNEAPPSATNSAAHLGVQILAQKPQHVLAQTLERQIPVIASLEADLAGAQPGLALARPEIARGRSPPPPR